jgi:hypothetical protein
MLTNWKQYQACPRCEAEAGRPCRNLVRPTHETRLPHPGRHVVPERSRSPRIPEDPSRLAVIVHQAMKLKGLRQCDLRRRLGWSKNHVSNVVTEAKYPMTVPHAEQILAIMGYRLESRAVPIEAESEQMQDLFLDERLPCGHRVPQFPCGPQERMQPMGAVGHKAMNQAPAIWCNSELAEPPAIWAHGRERADRGARQHGWISVDPVTFERLARKPAYVVGRDGKPL